MALGKVKPKTKKCVICKELFIPQRSMQKVCSPRCAVELSKRLQEKKQREVAKKERKAIAERKKALKTRSDWMKEAQAAFNAFIRERDKDKPCICCGRPLTNAIPGVRSHNVDAGHYRSVGSAPHLRFNEDNCHAQLVYCNRNRSGNAVAYRLGLIQRIGLERVEALEADQTVQKWTADDLKEIRDQYRLKLKELKK